jgi:hypothetical protein
VLLLLLAAASAHSPPNLGIVAADRVRMRQGPSVTHAVVRELPLGTVADIVDSTAERERVDQSREFSYRWFRVLLRAERDEGWIYGQYFYPLGSLYTGRVTVGGEHYNLAVFQEDAYLDDLPSQFTYALPCLIPERGGRASVISIDARTFTLLPSMRGGSLPGTPFLLEGSSAGSEEVTSIAAGRRGGSEVLRLRIHFNTQDSEGGYTLVIAPPARAGQPFRAVGVEDVVRSGL